MTEATFESRHVPKSQIINDALGRSVRPAVGVIISRALQDEIRATRGWISRPVVVDPAFQPAQFEIITSEGAWETKTASLKWADLEPYSARDTTFIRLGLAIFIGAAVALCVLGYLMFGR
ncbi:MAG: hypothetical protein JO289_03560 [Xanthobacteraceae bacterium]|nr:hypothetical protein [Xanthobacteraceae bacterium]